MDKSSALSSLNRSESVKKLETTEFDLLIIGGGITGTGIALDAASRGLKVALIEKADFSSGTSSRSTKLVHGGLRYLKQLEFGLVYEIGREREMLHNNAAHIVIPEEMLLPIIKGGSLGKYSVRLGLTLYDFLAGVKKEERNKILSRKKTLEREPLLNKDLIIGGALYYEYKTSDSRLTIETAKKAAEKGAILINYVKANDLIYRQKKLIAVEASDEIDKYEFKIYSKFVINAAGPWVDTLREKDHSIKKGKLHLTKGVHMVIPREKLPVNHANYFDVEDGRMIFIIPRGDKLYIGTTDTDYYDDIDNPRVTKNDVAYLLRAVKRLFPSVDLQADDVESTWAGLRPLIHKEGKSPSELSRKDEIFISKSGLISIAGGKLTGYRIMANKIVNIVMKKLHKNYKYNFKKCKTKSIKLSGGDFTFEISIKNLHEYFQDGFDEAKQTGIEVESFKILFNRYGTNIAIITNKAYDLYQGDKNWENIWLEAEIWYAVNHEMVQSLEDFFIRRTEMLYFEKNKCIQYLNVASNVLGIYLGWNKEKTEWEINNFKKNLRFIV